MTKFDSKKFQDFVAGSPYHRLRSSRDPKNYFVLLNARIEIIRQVLAEIYGARNVRVKKGRGKSHGWVRVEIILETRPHSYSKQYEKEQGIKEEVEQVLRQTGIRFSQFLSDGSDPAWNPCLLVQTSYRKKDLLSAQ